MYDLNSKFDIELHKKNYVNYLEVVILPDGVIEYAVPSHQEKLIKIACDRYKWTRDDLNKNCPEEYYFDFITWLCNITGCISVWNNYCVYPTDEGLIRREQIETLQKLKDNSLYQGEIL